MGIVEKMITGLAAFLWLVPPLVFLHIWPLPMPSQVLDQIWLYYLAFALAAYSLVRWFNPEKRGPLVIGICVAAFSIEVSTLRISIRETERAFAPHISWLRFSVSGWGPL